MLSTYGKSDEFPLLCEALAGRLETELGDVNSATLCFMCAANVSRTVGFWTQELIQANAARGQLDTVALQHYVEKVSVFTHANPVDNLGPDCTMFFATYADLLANQGRLEIALSYLKGENIAEKILIDRLYHAGNKKAGSRPPPFPFTKSVVETTASVGGNKAVVQKGTTAGGKSATPVISEAAARSATGKSTPAVQQNVAVTQRVETNKQSAAAAVPPATPATSQGLPAGWIQLLDPGSGHPYYVNQSTGQSQWEPPVPAVAIEPQKPQQINQQPQQLQQQQQYQQPQQQYQQPQQQQQYQQQQQFQPQVVNTSVAPVASSYPTATTKSAAADHTPVGPSATEVAALTVDSSCVAEFGQLIAALAGLPYSTYVLLAKGFSHQYLFMEY